jgi:hypothetical protein
MGATGSYAGGASVKLEDLCGTEVNADTTSYGCSYDDYFNVTFTEDCRIKVGKDTHLQIEDCGYEGFGNTGASANGYKFVIEGKKGASLSTSNLDVSGAPEIDIKFEGNSKDSPGSVDCYETVIDIEDSEFSAYNGDGRIRIATECGTIAVGVDEDNSSLIATKSVEVKAQTGDIDIQSNPFSGYNVSIASGAGVGGGEIKLEAGGLPYSNGVSHNGGNVYAVCVELSAGSIVANSQGSNPWIGCNY